MQELIQKITQFFQDELFNVAGISIKGLYVVIAAAVLLLIVIICICAGGKKRKAKKAAKKALKIAQNAEQNTQTEETSKTEVVADEVTEEKPVVDEVVSQEATKVDEEQPTPIVVSEVVPEVVPAEEQTVEVKPVEEKPVDQPKAATPKSPTTKSATSTKSTATKSSAKTSVKVDDKSAKHKARFSQDGTFEFTKFNEKVYFSLYANNGQKLYESRPYASLASAKNAVNTFKKNIAENELIVESDKNDNHHWTLTKGSLVIDGISYDSKASAEANAQSVKNFAATAIIAEKISD